MSHFKDNESYLHNHAIKVLEQWINKSPERFGISELLRTEKERTLCVGGNIIFKPDLIAYETNGISKFFEVCYTNPVSFYKLNRIQWFCGLHNWKIQLFEIKAEYIMKRTGIPIYPEMKQLI